jgi:anthranilate synthase component 1
MEMYTRIHPHFPYSYLLESLTETPRMAQYSFIGFNPQQTLSLKNGTLTHLHCADHTSSQNVSLDPLMSLKALFQYPNASPKEFRFTGGAVGYISYDAAKYWEKLPTTTIDDQNFPDLEFAIYDQGIIMNRQTRNIYYYHTTTDESDTLIQLLTQPSDLPPLHCSRPTINQSQDCFEANVKTAKAYIAAGDILQAVLSKRYDFTITGSLLHFYQALRTINPSPYMYFLQMDDRSIVGSSPEMLVRVVNRRVETYPIAGTRPRVPDHNQNQVFAQELLNDPKERAEHLMLVDLARNDIGKIAEFGSVHVPQFMQVHEYSHVQHLVSHVVGHLRPRHDSMDAFKAVFPAGTVSGAPKIRAMEIIDELEPTNRGPYAGAVGYFARNGNTDFAITIRTLIAQGTKASIQVGAGIVADSIPEREWMETTQKAQALLRALEQSGVTQQ